MLLGESFRVEFLQEVMEFLEEINLKANEKIIYNIEKVRVTKDKKLFKKLNQDIWEFRTLYKGLQYRLLAFWDKSSEVDTLIVATHGFIKKGDKVPVNQILKAEKIRTLYFEEKN